MPMVYRFMMFDVDTGDMVPSLCKATQEFIARERADVVPRTGEFVLAHKLDSEGRYYPPESADR